MAAIQHPPAAHHHQQQQGGGAMVAPEGFQVNDVRLAGIHAPEHTGVEGVAGSVTSFVRKLFQMVQGECDTVVGFVAGQFQYAVFAMCKNFSEGAVCSSREGTVETDSIVAASIVCY